MKLNLKRTAALAVAGVLTLGLAGITAQPATALPTTSTIRLITPSVNDTNSFNGTQLATDQDWAKYFGAGLTYRHVWAPAGATINLVYHVTTDGTTPMVNQPVVLRVGKGYSISTASITVDGQNTNMEKGSGADDQLDVAHYTDMYGNVSFTLQHNKDSADNAVAPVAKPANLTDKGEGGGKDLYTQLLPQVVGEKGDNADMTEFHFYTGDLVSTTPAATDIRVAAPIWNDTNSLHRGDLETLFSVTNPWYKAGIGVRNVWQEIGSKFNLAYHVADADGNSVLGAAFKLHVNKQYSGSNAAVTNGTTAAVAATDGADGAQWTATTDSFGNVLFSFENTNTTGGEPAAATDAAGVLGAGNGGLYSQIFPEILGQDKDSADMTEIHYVAKPVVVPPAAVKVVVSASGRTIKVTLTNAKGKAAKITITGVKATTKTPTKDSATVYSFKVTKGKKTVKVVVNGKTTTKSITIK